MIILHRKNSYTLLEHINCRLALGACKYSSNRYSMRMRDLIWRSLWFHIYTIYFFYIKAICKKKTTIFQRIFLDNQQKQKCYRYYKFEVEKKSEFVQPKKKHCLTPSRAGKLSTYSARDFALNCLARVHCIQILNSDDFFVGLVVNRTPYTPAAAIANLRVGLRICERFIYVYVCICMQIDMGGRPRATNENEK